MPRSRRPAESALGVKRARTRAVTSRAKHTQKKVPDTRWTSGQEVREHTPCPRHAHCASQQCASGLSTAPTGEQLVSADRDSAYCTTHRKSTVCTMLVPWSVLYSTDGQSSLLCQSPSLPAQAPCPPPTCCPAPRTHRDKCHHTPTRPETLLRTCSTLLPHLRLPPFFFLLP